MWLRGSQAVCTVVLLAAICTATDAHRHSTSRGPVRTTGKCMSSGAEPVSRASGFIGGLCNQFAPNTCVNSTSSTPDHFKTIVRAVRNSFELSPLCAQALHQVSCYSMDPWVGTGRVSGACGSLCMIALRACIEDYFAEDSMTSSAVSLRPCSHSDLVCTRLGTLLRHKSGLPPQPEAPAPDTLAHIGAAGEVTGESSNADMDGGLDLLALQAMAGEFCAAVGTPLSKAVGDATWNMPITPTTRLSGKCYSGSPRSGTGLQERPVGRADEPVLWYAKQILDSSYSALVSLLFRYGLVSENTMQRAKRGYFTQRGVHAGLGTASLLIGVLMALGFALCILYMISNIGAEEAAAMKMARARVAAADAAKKRALTQPINSIPEVLRAVELREGGGSGWSTEDVARVAALRAEGFADSDGDEDAQHA